MLIVTDNVWENERKNADWLRIYHIYYVNCLTLQVLQPYFRWHKKSDANTDQKYVYS